ncbi:tRNA (adenosine(37)-N6)-threonylcarbamoyltransferase complex transferase subunit TsaD, partial [Candidatus Gracilibacteria bacterium]|nr:tRNA (adenosine(37)-N6)-threonylcarbamoyltransferase complex transferase subunit TsaD [Candidatus Gracilibacteria bacterium]
MKILAIETSCDETAVAIVENGVDVLCNIVASQIDLHAKTGGVVPEVAARAHVIAMIPVLDEALAEADCSWDDIDAAAVTQGPGLVSSLIIGTETANVISYFKSKPLIPVQHITGHIYSNWLGRGDVEFPLLILTVSGGHNEMILMKGHHDFEVLGATRDDAAGEAFDKV